MSHIFIFRESLLKLTLSAIWLQGTLLISTGGSTPLLCLEGVPDLPVAPQDEAVLTTTFQMKFSAPFKGSPAICVFPLSRASLLQLKSPLMHNQFLLLNNSLQHTNVLCINPLCICFLLTAITSFHRLDIFNNMILSPYSSVDVLQGMGLSELKWRNRQCCIPFWTLSRRIHLLAPSRL